MLNTKGNKQLLTTDCRVRLQLHNLKVDAIVTHLIGDTIDNEGKDVNEKKRQKQAKELIEFANSRETQADLIILGGDLNLKPVHRSYKIINSDESGFEDTKVRNIFATYLIVSKGNHEEPCITFGHPANTYTDQRKDPMTLDYIFAKTTSNRAKIIATEQVVEEEEFQ